MVTIWDCWPSQLPLQPWFSQLLTSWTKEQAPKWIRRTISRYIEDSVKSGLDASEKFGLKFTGQIEKHNQKVQVKSLNAFLIVWSGGFTIQIKKSYLRQHNFASKCIKVTECFACKVIRDNTCLQSVTWVETIKKSIKLWFKKTLLCHGHFLTVQYKRDR